MFGVGFSEIVFIVVLAIIVLGPDKLPEAGKMLGKVLRQYKILKNDFMLRVNTPVTIDPTPHKPKSPDETTEIQS